MTASDTDFIQSVWPTVRSRELAQWIRKNLMVTLAEAVLVPRERRPSARSLSVSLGAATLVRGIGRRERRYLNVASAPLLNRIVASLLGS